MQVINKLGARVALAMALVAGAAFMLPPANASTIDWTLVGVTFDEGGAASGTFSTDSTNGNVSAFNISTTAGQTFGGYFYGSSTSFLACNDICADPGRGFQPNSFLIFSNDLFRYINLAFVNPLISPGFDVLVTGGDSFEGANFSNAPEHQRLVVTGAAVSAETPLPAALPLFATGLGVMGLLGWRRKRKNATALAVA